MRIRYAVVAALTLMGLASPASAAELNYVALGDSSVSGSGVPIQVDLVCTRSNRNWPAVVASKLNAKLTDVSCGGATVNDFSAKQFGFVPPQYDALRPDTDLVTLTIGGNDVSLVSTALGCVNALPEPVGVSCADRLGNSVSLAIQAWAPKLGIALEEIHRRSPDAEVIVAGYGTYIRHNGCWPVQPIWARDANFMQAMVDELSAAMRTQALAHNAKFVDLAPVTVGYDTCAPIGHRYIEGLVPVQPTVPLHPTAEGLAAYGAAVAASV
ncbi:hydrolase [Lentzea sp. NBRC 105346]|uniref:SGNH/GDSL hydrolase family protein n=1 Tax=Lentzea sp. NBRC 105346 TaxID=3032205 RepID=UPI0024A57062|nr:SGNH/GDSL hydrolase family protein [Lentzea sp. NBRC 105346]GLZ29581.1 hydrolase [Lentzea sp. NBRC 105346]